jgi:hypothetical protein
LRNERALIAVRISRGTVNGGRTEATNVENRVTSVLLEALHPQRGRMGWHGGPTPLAAIRGVHAELAAWAPAPGRKSIWQLALHVAYWKYAVSRRLAGGQRGSFPRRPANWPRVPGPPEAAAWIADCALLAEAHRRLLATVARVPRKSYGTPVRGSRRWTKGEMIVGIALHDAYHAGQIQMLKRLWAASRTGRG